MVGSAVWRALESKGYSKLIGKTISELDLRNQKAVDEFYSLEKPEVVIDAAAKVGGILANNDYPYQFLMENMQIQNNLIDGAFKSEIKKFIFLGSSCIYPKFAPQPLSSKEQAVIKSFRGVISKAPSPVRLDHPDFLEDLLRCSLGFSYEAALESLNTRAKLFLRVNAIKCNIDDAIDLLENEKVRSIRCRNASNSLLILDRVRNIESLRVFKRGKVEIQDI